MASTIKIQDTLNWAFAFIVGRPTTGVGGTANEPGLTNANLIMQTMLSAPFKWEWNRAETTFSTTAGVSDYSENLASFGYLEKATITNNTVTPPTMELLVHRVLAKEGKQNPPRNIAILLDDNAGNITFRLSPIPDAVYTVTLTYQKAPQLATGLGNATWAPIPDKLALVYEQGMLARLQMMYSQQTAAMNMEIFFRMLVSVAQGLTETEKALFLEDSLRTLKTREAELLGTQQGKQARL